LDWPIFFEKWSSFSSKSPDGRMSNGIYFLHVETVNNYCGTNPQPYRYHFRYQNQDIKSDTVKEDLILKI